MLRNTRILLSSLALVAVFGMPESAEARDVSATDIRRRVEDINVEIADLEVHEHADSATREFAQARLEITDVQSQVAREEIAQAEVVLRRLEARVNLIRSSLERATVEELAQQRESELLSLQQEADELMLELETAQRRRQRLQDDVSTIVENM